MKTRADLAELFACRKATCIVAWNRILDAEYCPRHCHPCFEIVYHPSGDGVTSIPGNTEIQVGNHSVVVYSPYTYHDLRMHASGQEICIQIDVGQSIHQGLQPVFHIPSLQSLHLRNELLCISDAAQCQSELGEIAFNYRVLSLLISLLDLSAPVDNQPMDVADTYFEQADRYMRENYRVIGSVREVAVHVGVSYDHLRHVFRKCRGTSLISHLTYIRITRAKELIQNSTLPFKAIAELCGFENERYFSAVFKSVVGCTPGTLRKSID